MNHATYDDRKFCQACDTYVHYLMSVEQSFCTQCGGEVRLLSDQDWTAFQQQLADKRPKGGRPKRKRTAAATAS